MAESFEFEVRPIENATAVVGEEVTFKSEGGKLYALNEDGEAFGVVPAKFASQLEGLGEVAATVASRSGGVPTIAVEVPVGPAPEDVAATAPVEASAEAEEDQAEAPDEFAQESEDAASAPEVETESKVKAAQGETDADKIESAESDAPAAQADASANASGKKKSKTKYIAIAAVAAVVIVVIACVGLFSGEKKQTVTLDWLSVEVPEDWTVDSDSDAEETYVYPDDFTGFVAICGPDEIGHYVDYQYEIFDDVIAPDYYDGEVLDDSSIDDAVVQRLQVESSDLIREQLDEIEELADYAEDEWAGYVYYIYSGTEYMELKVFCLADEYDDHADELEEVLESVVLEDAQEPETVMQTLSDDEVSIEVPADWLILDEQTSDDYYLVEVCQWDLALSVTFWAGYSLEGASSVDFVLSCFEEIYGLDSSTLEQSEYEDSAVICRYDYSYTYEGDDYEYDMIGYMEIVFSGDEVSWIIVLSSEDEFSENSEKLESILDSLTIENPSEPDFS